MSQQLRDAYRSLADVAAALKAIDDEASTQIKVEVSSRTEVLAVVHYAFSDVSGPARSIRNQIKANLQARVAQLKALINTLE